MRLLSFEAITSRVAQCANNLNIVVILCSVTEVVIVLMTTLTLKPDVLAISAGKSIRMRTAARFYLGVHSLAGL